MSQLEDKLDTLIDLMTRAQGIPVEKDLWDRKMVCAYLKCSRRQLEHYLMTAGFPVEVRLPKADGTRSHPRWRAADIMAWVDQQARRAQYKAERDRRSQWK